MRFGLTHRFVMIAMAGLLALTPACSWQKIPPEPEYTTMTPIPMVVGVELDDSAYSLAYGTQAITEIREMKVFQYIIWPYNSGTPVDAVLKLSIDGVWKTTGGVRSAIFVGLTLGLLGPFLGPKTTGDHNVTAILERDAKAIVNYSFRAETVVSHGLSANEDVVMFKAEALQTRKITVGLATRFNDDRDKISGARVTDDAEAGQGDE